MKQIGVWIVGGATFLLFGCGQPLASMTAYRIENPDAGAATLQVSLYAGIPQQSSLTGEIDCFKLTGGSARLDGVPLDISTLGGKTTDDFCPDPTFRLPSERMPLSGAGILIISGGNHTYEMDVPTLFDRRTVALVGPDGTLHTGDTLKATWAPATDRLDKAELDFFDGQQNLFFARLAPTSTGAPEFNVTEAGHLQFTVPPAPFPNSGEQPIEHSGQILLGDLSAPVDKCEASECALMVRPLGVPKTLLWPP